MSQGFFDQVLFYGISESKVYTGSLSLLSQEKNKISIDFAFSEKDILAKMTAKTLFVVAEFYQNSPNNRIGHLVYELGSPYIISFRFWEEKSREILAFSPILKESQNEVILAFFNKSEQNLFYSLFSLYGFTVITVNNHFELKRTLKPKDKLILLNLDFSRDSEPYPKEIFFTLRTFYQNNAQLAICAMKDFSKLSFLSDLQSPLKEFCRTIFSKEEMFLFFRDYLFAYSYTDLFKKMESQILQFPPSFSLPLRNIPPLLEKLGTFSNEGKLNKSIAFYENLSKLVLCHQLTEGIAHFLQKSDAHEKATFHFIEKAPLFSTKNTNWQNVRISEYDPAVQ